MFKIIFYLILSKNNFKGIGEIHTFVDSHHQIYGLLISKILKFFSLSNNRNKNAQIIRKESIVCTYALF